MAKSIVKIVMLVATLCFCSLQIYAERSVEVGSFSTVSKRTEAVLASTLYQHMLLSAVEASPAFKLVQKSGDIFIEGLVSEKRVLFAINLIIEVKVIDQKTGKKLTLVQENIKETSQIPDHAEAIWKKIVSAVEGYWVSGQILDWSGRPLPNVRMEVTSNTTGVFTTSDGLWKIDGLNTKVKITPSKTGWCFIPGFAEVTSKSTVVDFRAYPDIVQLADFERPPYGRARDTDSTQNFELRTTIAAEVTEGALDKHAIHLVVSARNAEPWYAPWGIDVIKAKFPGLYRKVRIRYKGLWPSIECTLNTLTEGGSENYHEYIIPPSADWNEATFSIGNPVKLPILSLKDIENRLWGLQIGVRGSGQVDIWVDKIELMR